MKERREAAKKLLTVITNTYILGSANIRPLSYAKLRRHSDRISIYPSLFSRKEQQRTVEALIDEPVKNIGNRRIVEFREENRQKAEEDKSKDLYMRIRLSRSRQIECSMKAMAGNCVEMCSFGLKYVTDSKDELLAKQRVEVMKFAAPFDHCFLVMGRDPATPINDYTRWNKDVLIIDPWLNKIMTLDEFDKFWKQNFPVINSYSVIPYPYRKSRTMQKKLSFKLEKYLDSDSIGFRS